MFIPLLQHGALPLVSAQEPMRTRARFASGPPHASGPQPPAHGPARAKTMHAACFPERNRGQYYGENQMAETQ
eukprot:6718336-Pyramimonas_sp.AAC.1